MAMKSQTKEWSSRDNYQQWSNGRSANPSDTSGSTNLPETSFCRGMMGRTLRIVILCIVTGVTGLTQRVVAQSQDEEEDMSTGEISEEISSADLISDETSVDDDSSDDLFPPSGEDTIPRPRRPAQPSR